MKKDYISSTIYVNLYGTISPVKIVLTIIKRKEISRVLAIVRKFNPLAFFTIEDIRSAWEDVFRPIETK
jgi:uncharacterized membrane-anchored protein YitT (DUF2179 family)